MQITKPSSNLAQLRALALARIDQGQQTELTQVSRTKFALLGEVNPDLAEPQIENDHAKFMFNQGFVPQSPKPAFWSKQKLIIAAAAFLAGSAIGSATTLASALAAMPAQASSESTAVTSVADCSALERQPELTLNQLLALSQSQAIAIGAASVMVADKVDLGGLTALTLELTCGGKEATALATIHQVDSKPALKQWVRLD